MVTGRVTSPKVYPSVLTLLHSERPKLHTILAFLSAIWLSNYEKSLVIFSEAVSSANNNFSKNNYEQSLNHDSINRKKWKDGSDCTDTANFTLNNLNYLFYLLIRAYILHNLNINCLCL